MKERYKEIRDMKDKLPWLILILCYLGFSKVTAKQKLSALSDLHRL